MPERLTVKEAFYIIENKIQGATVGVEALEEAMELVRAFINSRATD
jgi:hypothetical protein